MAIITSKSEGIRLCKDLNNSLEAGQASKVAVHIDSQSRNGDDYDAARTWDQLKKKGKFDCRVLITTSVLDSGFSIKDSQVKNIVICSDDRTEFLQELGRLRITENDQICLFIRKLSERANANRRQLYERYSSLFMEYCGELDSKAPGVSEKYLRKGDPCKAVNQLWNEREDSRRKIIHLVATPDGTLKPNINWMARWRTILLGKQIEDYESLLAENEVLAPAWYKAQWLTPDRIDRANFDVYLQSRDLDIDTSNQSKRALIDFLRGLADSGKELKEGSEEFESFSTELRTLYARAYPKDGSVNSGKNRKPWQKTAINNHLDSVKDGEYVYNLEEAEDKKGVYLLRRKDKPVKGDVSE